MVAIPLDALSRVAKPIVFALGAINRPCCACSASATTRAGAITEEEIHLLVSESHEQGVIDADERNMMNRVMRLGDRTAESLMTPRMRIPGSMPPPTARTTWRPCARRPTRAIRSTAATIPK